MGKSYRKTSICGCTTAKSEKKDKQIYNKKLRRITKQFIRNDILNEMILPSQKEIQDVWLMSKDGKYYFDKDKFPELMRK